MKKSILSLALAVIMVMALLTIGAFAEEKTVSDVDGLKEALATADDGDTIAITAGTYDIGSISLSKCVSLKGAGAGATKLVGTIQYKFTEPQMNKTISISDLTLEAGASSVQGIQFCASGVLASKSILNIDISNCAFDGWQYALTMNSHADGYNMTVSGCDFTDSLYAVSYTCDTITVGQPGDNSLKFSGNNVINPNGFAVQKFNNQVSTSEDFVDNTYETVESFDNGEHIKGNVKYVNTVDALKTAISNAKDGDTIVVAPGNYDGVVEFDGKSLTIKAQYPAYVNGVQQADDSKLSKFTGTFNTYHSSNICNTNQTVVIEGFAFSGDGLKVGNSNYNSVGTLVVRNCTMELASNKTSDPGNPYGLLNYFVKVSDDVEDNYAAVVVEDNYIFGTPAANIIPIQLWHVNSATVKNNKIVLEGNNELEVISISILDENAKVVVDNNEITNAGGGIYVTTWKCDNGFNGYVTIEDNELYCGGTPIFVGYPDDAGNTYGAFNGTLIDDNNTNNGAPVAAEVGQKPGSTGYYTVTVMSGNSVVDAATVESGTEYTLPNVTNSGYIFLGWRDNNNVTHKAGEVVAITADTTFTAVWGNLPDVKPSEPETPETPVFPFYDVTARDWYYSAVKYVYEKGLMDGVDVGVFAPNDTLTRAMVWTIIARAEGVDTTGGATWYAKAQEWVTAKGISDGENPSAAITRQELVTMLYRLAGEPAVSGTITAPDAASVSTWATDAMTWAMNIGLVEGDENGAVTPTATATRAQAAALIMRYLEA
mgnify:FL=1